MLFCTLYFTCTLKIYSVIRLSSRKCVINSVFSVQSKISTDRKSVCNFLLVINSNFGRNLRGFGNQANSRAKTFYWSPLINAFAGGETCRNFGWIFSGNQKSRASEDLCRQTWVTLIQNHVTDGRTNSSTRATAMCIGTRCNSSHISKDNRL